MSHGLNTADFQFGAWARKDAQASATEVVLSWFSLKWRSDVLR